MTSNQEEHIKKHAYYTDNKIRTNKSMAKPRLTGSMREIAALNFLLKKRGTNPLIEDLYMILAMKNDFIFPRHNTDYEKKVGKKLLKNKEIVDLVLHRLFHWFGSNVGLAEISKLVEILKDWPNEPLGNLTVKKEKTL